MPTPPSPPGDIPACCGTPDACGCVPLSFGSTITVDSIYRIKDGGGPGIPLQARVSFAGTWDGTQFVGIVTQVADPGIAWPTGTFHSNGVVTVGCSGSCGTVQREWTVQPQGFAFGQSFPLSALYSRYPTGGCINPATVISGILPEESLIPQGYDSLTNTCLAYHMLADKSSYYTTLDFVISP